MDILFVHAFHRHSSLAFHGGHPIHSQERQQETQVFVFHLSIMRECTLHAFFAHPLCIQGAKTYLARHEAFLCLQVPVPELLIFE